jgi:hypothetical protein
MIKNGKKNIINIIQFDSINLIITFSMPSKESHFGNLKLSQKSYVPCDDM